jgi:hypothetical protein
MLPIRQGCGYMLSIGLKLPWCGLNMKVYNLESKLENYAGCHHLLSIVYNKLGRGDDLFYFFFFPSMHACY